MSSSTIFMFTNSALVNIIKFEILEACMFTSHHRALLEEKQLI